MPFLASISVPACDSSPGVKGTRPCSSLLLLLALASSDGGRLSRKILSLGCVSWLWNEGTHSPCLCPRGGRRPEAAGLPQKERGPCLVKRHRSDRQNWTGLGAHDAYACHTHGQNTPQEALSKARRRRSHEETPAAGQQLHGLEQAQEARPPAATGYFAVRACACVWWCSDRGGHRSNDG